MNAYYLHKPDGTPTGVSACGKCGLVAGKGNFDVSDKCCTCLECREPLGDDELRTRSMYHPACTRARHAKIELARIEKAKLVEDYDGPVYLEGVGSGSMGDGYFANLDELAEHLDLEDGARPEFAFCCTSSRVINVNIDHILESLTEDSYEGAYDDLTGVDELAIAVNKFNDANESVISYETDYKRKVRIPNAEESQ